MCSCFAALLSNWPIFHELFFYNLLFALFTSQCPLFRAIRTVIDALKEFSKQAREALCNSSKASILWIILLQSRQFAICEMGVMCEFQTMHNDLRAKRANIHHSEMPLELLTNSTNTDPAAPAPKEEQVVDVDKVGEKPPKKRYHYPVSRAPNASSSSFRSPP